MLLFSNNVHKKCVHIILLLYASYTLYMLHSMEIISVKDLSPRYDA